MTKPKNWHLKSEDSEIFLWYHAGPMKRPGASDALGSIRAVTVPSPSEYSGKIPENDALLVSQPVFVS